MNISECLPLAVSPKADGSVLQTVLHYATKVRILVTTVYGIGWCFRFTMILMDSSEEADILVRVGTRIRKLRRERHLSQDKLALECDLTQTFLSQIERGIVIVTIAGYT